MKHTYVKYMKQYFIFVFSEIVNTQNKKRALRILVLRLGLLHDQ